MNIGKDEQDVLLVLLGMWEQNARQINRKERRKMLAVRLRIPGVQAYDLSPYLEELSIWRSQIESGLLPEDTIRKIVRTIHMMKADAAGVNSKDRNNEKTVSQAIERARARDPELKGVLDNFDLLLSNLQPKQP
jgi:hypothetical protein